MSKAEQLAKRLAIFEKKIYDFDGFYYLSEYRTPEKEGFYLTIRCGLGGIYSHVNEWKNGKWQACAADASKVIAFSKELFDMDELVGDLK